MLLLHTVALLLFVQLSPSFWSRIDAVATGSRVSCFLEKAKGKQKTQMAGSSEILHPVQRCIQLLREKGIRVVIWDMDLTIVRQHSRGRLPRGESLEEFLSKTSEDFITLVPSLYKEGFKLAIATHSDTAEYSKKIQPETHILGQDLATTLLQRHFSPSIANNFYIVAYNPAVRLSWFQKLNGGWAKRHHMKEIQSHFESEPEEMIFFDDTKPIVMDCERKCGVKSIRVNPMYAFRLSDILDNL
jgi:hypothetical protein